MPFYGTPTLTYLNRTLSPYASPLLQSIVNYGNPLANMRIPPAKFDFMEKQLSKMREKSGMTLAEVSEASHVPLSTVARIFSGQTSDPGVRTLTAIVSAMGGSIDDLVGIPRPAPSDQTEVINHLRHELRVREKWLVRLFVFVVVVIGLVAVATLWDIFTPAVGYIRY